MKNFLIGIFVGMFFIRPLYDLYKALFANIIGRLLYIPPITTGVGAGMHHPTNSNYVGEAFYNRRRFDDFN